MKSFFVRGPDKVLIEIVEADPLPEASWLRHTRPPGRTPAKPGKAAPVDPLR